MTRSSHRFSNNLSVSVVFCHFDKEDPRAMLEQANQIALVPIGMWFASPIRFRLCLPLLEMTDSRNIQQENWIAYF